MTAPSETTRPHRHVARLGMAALAALPLVALSHPHPASASVTVYDDPVAAYAVASALEADRAWVHMPGLVNNAALGQVALNHAVQMAEDDELFDSANLASVAGPAVPGWVRLGENSGVGWSPAQIAYAFVHSTPHLANILGPYDMVGVAAVSTGTTLWVTEVFAAR